ncbi:hypothetical protein P7C73_g6765, partial [Tremellales sp. Uapishka_1]
MSLLSIFPTLHDSFSHLATPATTPLNPYLPLPTTALSILLTTPTYLPSLPFPTSSALIHVLESTSSTPLIIRGEDVVLISRTNQEAYDHALLGLRLAAEGNVVYHYVASESSGSIDEISSDDLKSWLNSTSSPLLNGEEESLLKSYEAASLSLLKITRRAQRPFHAPSSSDADSIVLNFLPSTVSSPNIEVNLVSPLPIEKIKHSIAGKEVVILEGGSGKYGSVWAAVVPHFEGSVKSVLVGESADLSTIASLSAPISRLGKPAAAPALPASS